MKFSPKDVGAIGGGNRACFLFRRLCISAARQRPSSANLNGNDAAVQRIDAVLCRLMPGYAGLRRGFFGPAYPGGSFSGSFVLPKGGG